MQVSLNPYSTGRYSMRAGDYVKSANGTRLNPYSTGRYSMSWFYSLFINSKIVLILILLEDTL